MAISPARKIQIKKDFDGALSTGAYAYAKQLQATYPALNKYFDKQWRAHCDIINAQPGGDVEEEVAA